MKLSVYNTKGKETSKSVTLSKDIFGIEPNRSCYLLRCETLFSCTKTRNSQIKRKR